MVPIVVEELAAAGRCDLLAHLDLVKVTGTRPDRMPEFHQRLDAAAAAHDLAVEVSSAGLRKPVNEVYPAAALLLRLREQAVPVTRLGRSPGRRHRHRQRRPLPPDHQRRYVCST